MGIKQPYKRTCRIFTDNSYSRSGKLKYIKHPDYAESPGHFVRAFNILQNDMIKLFEYIEPSDDNLGTHSFRIHELLLRTCVEIEANFTAILRENSYIKKGKGNWNINDYKNINQSHYLSKYQVLIPNWLGNCNIYSPFHEWDKNKCLTWYQDYNKSKHDRHTNFSKATFSSFISAICGLAIVIASQFHTEDFSGINTMHSVSESDINNKFKNSIGGYFMIKFPEDIPESEKYDFTSDDINYKENIFKKFNYID